MAINNQKLKLLYLVKIFTEDTDDQHALTLPQIVDKLHAYGVNAERKTLYQDFELLRDFGVDIIGVQMQRSYYYHIGNRDFELPELKLLVDSVQSAKFITDKKSNALIRKLEGMVSKYEARQLQRQVIISGRVKAMNESIYFNVDKLHEAIGTGSQIKFKYFQWNLKKEMELRKGGAWYQVSPWGLMWDDENYYLVGYDAEDEKIKHYRVDKMLRISLVNKKREGKEQFKAGMVGVLIDRFGKDMPVKKVDETHFRTIVNVAVSNQFLGWIMALGKGVRIIGPDSVVRRMKEEIQQISRMYEDG